MSPQELIQKLISVRGPCTRLCAYCCEEFETAEVKECVENMIRTIYMLRADKEALIVENDKLKEALLKYSKEIENEDNQTIG